MCGLGEREEKRSLNSKAETRSQTLMNTMGMCSCLIMKIGFMLNNLKSENISLDFPFKKLSLIIV